MLLLCPHLDWCIWKERNNRIFSGIESLVIKVFISFYKFLVEFLLGLDCLSLLPSLTVDLLRDAAFQIPMLGVMNLIESRARIPIGE